MFHTDASETKWKTTTDDIYHSCKRTSSNPNIGWHMESIHDDNSNSYDTPCYKQPISRDIECSNWST